MVPVVERALAPAVLANRASGGGARWALEPVATALRRAGRASGNLIGTPVALRTDVKAFYASVSPTVLATALQRVGAGRRDSREAAALLEGWGSEGYPGLPIGPPGSAVLANAVLDPVDRSLGGMRFLRWVDDYLVAVPSERAAREAQERIEEALDALGLEAKRSKTTIGPWPWVWPGGRDGVASLAPLRPAGTIAAP